MCSMHVLYTCIYVYKYLCYVRTCTYNYMYAYIYSWACMYVNYKNNNKCLKRIVFSFLFQFQASSISSFLISNITCTLADKKHMVLQPYNITKVTRVPSSNNMKRWIVYRMKGMCHISSLWRIVQSQVSTGTL